MSKPILALDFDGVVHSYSSGWKGGRCIPDPPVPGALQFMYDALSAGQDVVIHSSRARYFGGIWMMRNWLRGFALERSLWYEDGLGGTGLEFVRFVRWKPSATISIDDRALTFTGTWPDLKKLKEFKPWNKQAPRALT